LNSPFDHYSSFDIANLLVAKTTGCAADGIEFSNGLSELSQFWTPQNFPSMDFSTPLEAAVLEKIGRLMEVSLAS